MITAGIVIVVTEVAKSSDKVGGFITAIPLIAILTLIWLYVDKAPQEKIGNYARYTFWYVIPTLPMFFVFPLLLPKLGFWLTLFVCLLISIILFGICVLALKPFWINLL